MQQISAATIPLYVIGDGVMYVKALWQEMFGLVGRTGSYYSEGGAVTQCYSTGPVSGVGAVGGLVGYNNHGDVTNCFWDIQTSGRTTSAGRNGQMVLHWAVSALPSLEKRMRRILGHQQLWILEAKLQGQNQEQIVARKLRRA